jgi:hypothetical protein
MLDDVPCDVQADIFARAAGTSFDAFERLALAVRGPRLARALEKAARPIDVTYVAAHDLPYTAHAQRLREFARWAAAHPQAGANVRLSIVVSWRVGAASPVILASMLGAMHGAPDRLTAVRVMSPPAPVANSAVDWSGSASKWRAVGRMLQRFDGIEALTCPFECVARPPDEDPRDAAADRLPAALQTLHLASASTVPGALVFERPAPRLRRLVAACAGMRSVANLAKMAPALEELDLSGAALSGVDHADRVHLSSPTLKAAVVFMIPRAPCVRVSDACVGLERLVIHEAAAVREIALPARGLPRLRSLSVARLDNLVLLTMRGDYPALTDVYVGFNAALAAFAMKGAAAPELQTLRFVANTSLHILELPRDRARLRAMVIDDNPWLRVDDAVVGGGAVAGDLSKIVVKGLERNDPFDADLRVVAPRVAEVTFEADDEFTGAVQIPAGAVRDLQFRGLAMAAPIAMMTDVFAKLRRVDVSHTTMGYAARRLVESERAAPNLRVAKLADCGLEGVLDVRAPLMWRLVCDRNALLKAVVVHEGAACVCVVSVRDCVSAESVDVRAPKGRAPIDVHCDGSERLTRVSSGADFLCQDIA